ncbi:MAG TPA: Hsp20/alpha crystallin family protein [Cyclobacteriaceae bacterium]|nr:Hsp20/alpha crystallin family protein [Cyclobacteriaceae bacterium]
MSIIRYNPADFVPTTFSSIIDKFFNESIQKSGMNTFVPKVDIIESEKAFELQVEVPGMNKEDFKIEVNDNYLTISGERKLSSEKKEKNFHSIETSYGTFTRSFTLPENVNADKIHAKYNNGILELTVPKDEKKVLKSTIKVD